MCIKSEVFVHFVSIHYITSIMHEHDVQIFLFAGYLEIERTDGSLRTGSQLIASELKIGCAVLNGANVANDVAHEHFAEASHSISR